MSARWTRLATFGLILPIAPVCAIAQSAPSANPWSINPPVSPGLEEQSTFTQGYLRGFEQGYRRGAEQSQSRTGTNPAVAHSAPDQGANAVRRDWQPGPSQFGVGVGGAGSRGAAKATGITTGGTTPITPQQGMEPQFLDPRFDPASAPGVPGGTSSLGAAVPGLPQQQRPLQQRWTEYPPMPGAYTTAPAQPAPAVPGAFPQAPVGPYGQPSQAPAAPYAAQPPSPQGYVGAPAYVVPYAGYPALAGPSTFTNPYGGIGSAWMLGGGPLGGVPGLTPF